MLPSFFVLLGYYIIPDVLCQALFALIFVLFRPCEDGVLLLSVKKQKVTKEFFVAAQREDFGCAKSSVRRLLFLRRPIQELLSFTVRRIAAFDTHPLRIRCR